jgi:uncharacterized membrane protein YcaP (DUF421 family)
MNSADVKCPILDKGEPLMDTDALFGTGQALTIAIKAVVFYAYMVLLLRISGKRTTMEMTSFDFVSTVAMATIIGSTILQGTITLIEGMVAVTALVIMQWIAGQVSARSARIRHLITSTPSLLFKDGVFIEENLAAERVSREQVMQKVRAAGHASTESVSAIVMESAGTISIVDKSKSQQELELEA